MKNPWRHHSVNNLMDLNTEKDPIKIIKEEAQNLVLEGFNKGWSGPPYDPVELSQLIGINVTPNELINDARIIPLDQSFKIEYNPFQNSKRINFSIAHEIAHTLFPDCNEKIRNREVNNPSEWELEFLCNIGAAEILLPYGKFLSEVNKLPLNLDSILLLSDIFHASLESVLLRFCEVIEAPCTFFITTFVGENFNKLKVNYSKSSRQSIYSLERGDIIPKHSKAYDCLNSGWSSQGKEKWDIFGDDELMIYAIGLPPLKYINSNRVGILLAPASVAEAPKNKLHTIVRDATEPAGTGMKIIVQVVNTLAALGAGFGKSLATKYPIIKKNILNWKQNKEAFKLGNVSLIQVDSEIFVFQMIAQDGIKSSPSTTLLKYDALRNCLQKLANIALEMNATVHMPLIGAGQARGNWALIEGIIEEEVVLKGVDVTVYLLPGHKINPEKPKTLTLFD